MMKGLIIAFLAVAGLSANAEVAGPLWGCQIKAVLSGKSVGVIVSVTNIEGVGAIKR